MVAEPITKMLLPSKPGKGEQENSAGWLMKKWPQERHHHANGQFQINQAVKREELSVKNFSDRTPPTTNHYM